MLIGVRRYDSNYRKPVLAFFGTMRWLFEEQMAFSGRLGSKDVIE